jgi:hypothetical protein
MKDHASYCYKTTGTFKMLHILILTSLESRTEEKYTELNGIRHP